MQEKVANRTIFCHDNLEILQGINSNSIDLIYLDPPFNKKKQFTAPIGSSAEGASFSDIFQQEDVKDDWLQTIKEDQDKIYNLLTAVKSIEGSSSYNYCYLAYMAIRLIETRRILKDTGSIYLHCDPTMSHYLKIVMDCVFGEKNFRNEVVWGYPPGGKGPKLGFHRKHDIILYYGKSVDKGIFHRPYSPINERAKAKFTYIEKDTERVYKKYPGGISYLDESKGRPIPSWWVDIHSLGQTISKERTGYPTQKPIALLERIIQASSNEGDIVLDPFCGCATTCVAAELLNRKWIGVDISVKAHELVQKRLKDEVWNNPNSLLQYRGDFPAITCLVSPPQRTDLGIDYREQKYVYVISNPSYPGDYKVGIAKNWKARLDSYQTSDPYRSYTMEYKVLTPYFRELEAHIHNIFPNNHEWISANLDDIKEIMNSFTP